MSYSKRSNPCIVAPPVPGAGCPDKATGWKLTCAAAHGTRTPHAMSTAVETGVRRTERELALLFIAGPSLFCEPVAEFATRVAPAGPLLRPPRGGFGGHHTSGAAAGNKMSSGIMPFPSGMEPIHIGQRGPAAGR